MSVAHLSVVPSYVAVAGVTLLGCYNSVLSVHMPGASHGGSLGAVPFHMEISKISPCAPRESRILD